MHPKFIFPPEARPALPVVDDERLFPVRALYCVGRNYAEHAREMGADPDREPPFFFGKAAHAVVGGRQSFDVAYPPATADLHHEVELVVALGPGLEILGYAVGIDLTRRDLQAEAKKLSRPWTMAKSFAGAAPVGPLLPATRIGHPRAGRIALSVNGAVRQEGDLGQMIWSVEEVIDHLRRLDTLAPGDLVFTGTPAGVGPVVRGDTLRAEIEGVGAISVRLV